MAATIRAKLESRFHPESLEIVDESDRHAGHAGAQGGGESHFQLKIVSSAFGGLSKVARQRLIYDTLREELEERVHALSIKALTPQEDGC